MSVTLQEQIGRLEQRLAELERQRRGWRMLCGLAFATLLAGFGLLAAPTSEAKVAAPKVHSVPAPFHVVDKAGKVLFSVDEKKVTAHSSLIVEDTSGKIILVVDDGRSGALTGKRGRGMMVADESSRVVAFTGEGEGGCGTLETFESSGERVVGLGKVGVRVYGKGQKTIARIGRNDDAGDQGFVGVGKDGIAMAGIGSKDDVGFIELGGKDQKNFVELGKSGVQVLNAGKVVGRLGFSPSGTGAGFFALGNPQGEAIIEGGMLPDKRGVVRAYPFKPRTGDILVGQNLIIGAKE